MILLFYNIWEELQNDLLGKVRLLRRDEILVS